MNRIIKFRAWDKEQNKMYDLERCLGFEISDFLNPRRGHTDLMIMQFTGLLDKNGKEIYEGDIVKNKYRDVGVITFGNHETSTDVYASDAYGWYVKCELSTFSMAQYDTEIIGNIYESPELLTPNLNK